MKQVRGSRSFLPEVPLLSTEDDQNFKIDEEDIILKYVYAIHTLLERQLAISIF